MTGNMGAMTDVLAPVERHIELRESAPARPIPSSAIGLASLSASAGLIHAALAPSHMGEWTLEGLGFAVAAWVQLGVAVALLRRRSIAALQIAIVSNLTFIAVWLMSRTSGFPFGPHAGHPERFSFVDEVAVAAEALLVIGSFAAMTRPRLRITSGWMRAVVPAIAVLATTAAILSPSARNHAHDAHGTHVHAGDTVTAQLFPNGDDHGFSLLHNGHHAPFVTYELDTASRAELDRELAITRQVAKRFPNVAAAEAAGYHRAGPYVPGLGAHWISADAIGLNFDGAMSDDDLAHPTSLEFDGVAPASKLAGFMYVSLSTTEPVGFIGRNDVWHYHTNLCLKMSGATIEAPYGFDGQATAKQCASVGGSLWSPPIWMVHVWTAPGFSNPYGVFGENNPKLSCSDGSYYVLPAAQWASHNTNVCVANAS